jgi:hypothetical protein
MSIHRLAIALTACALAMPAAADSVTYSYNGVLDTAIGGTLPTDPLPAPYAGITAGSAVQFSVTYDTDAPNLVSAADATLAQKYRAIIGYYAPVTSYSLVIDGMDLTGNPEDLYVGVSNYDPALLEDLDPGCNYFAIDNVSFFTQLTADDGSTGNFSLSFLDADGDAIDSADLVTPSQFGDFQTAFGSNPTAGVFFVDPIDVDAPDFDPLPNEPCDPFDALMIDFDATSGDPVDPIDPNPNPTPTVVPSPTAFAAGLAMLGLVVSRRRQAAL